MRVRQGLLPQTRSRALPRGTLICASGEGPKFPSHQNCEKSISVVSATQSMGFCYDSPDGRKQPRTEDETEISPFYNDHVNVLKCPLMAVSSDSLKADKHLSVC